MNKIGTRIKELREEKNLTQEELAKVLNLSQDSISLWEKGKRIPNTQYVVLFAIYFKVSTDYLLGLENENGTKVNNIHVTNSGTITNSFNNKQ